jgi:hypothetical protein
MFILFYSSVIRNKMRGHRSSSLPPKDALYNLCSQILQLDEKIRFAGIANHLGTLLASAYRHGLVPLLTREETSHYALQSVLRAATREDFESKLGRQEYSIGKNGNVVRATIPIIYIEEAAQERNVVVKDNDESTPGIVKFYLLLSFDVEYEAQHAIEKKILPFLEENKKVFIAH